MGPHMNRVFLASYFKIPWALADFAKILRMRPWPTVDLWVPLWHGSWSVKENIAYQLNTHENSLSHLFSQWLLPIIIIITPIINPLPTTLPHGISTHICTWNGSNENKPTQFWGATGGLLRINYDIIVTFGPTSRSHSPLPHLPFYFGHSTFGSNWDLGAGVFGTL